MRIAVLAASDASQYRALMLHAYAHAADAFTSTQAERAAEPAQWWANRLAGPTGSMIVFGALSGQDLVGTVAVGFSARQKTRHKAQVVAMFVRETWRGQGLARSLLRAAVDQCRQRGGIHVLQLEVTQGNEPAVRLYRSLGFRQFGLEPMAVRTPQGFRSKIHMWLQLGEATGVG